MQQNIGFISDLHLSPRHKEITALFESYLKNSAAKLKEIYILGDLFDYWIGDDYDREYNQYILNLLENIRPKVFFIPGNRDFLITKVELRKHNITLLPDPTVITIASKRVLLTHGDQFCTSDHAYQLMRKVFQHQHTKQLFLQLPLAMRQLTATTTRTISNKENKRKNTAKLTTVTKTVLAFADKHQADLIIHGHTHTKQIDNYNSTTRIIMPSWEPNTASELILDSNGNYHFVDVT